MAPTWAVPGLFIVANTFQYDLMELLPKLFREKFYYFISKETEIYLVLQSLQSKVSSVRI